jgi:hypothetical protein
MCAFKSADQPQVQALLLFVPVAERCSPPPSARSLGQKAAMVAVETKETKMRTYSLTELFYLTRSGLFALHAKITAELAVLPEDAEGRPVALDTLRLIRRALARHRPAP